MAEISNYDFFDYDYSQYWKKRHYENSAETHLLNNIFKNKRGIWFLDIGGSYGRLTQTYYNQYLKPIVLDYSLKTLQKNRDVIKIKYPNVELIAANAYKMPFKENVFDGALMVRVLHHIEKPSTYYTELQRILKTNSTYVQEFANKIHLKSALKAIFRLDFKFFSETPYQQPSAKNFEGTKSGEEALFYNYHPKYISKLLTRNNFEIRSKKGCSFLRSQILKKILGENLMISIEKILQKTFSWTNISPSIFLEAKMIKEKPVTNNQTLEEILACPDCKSKLEFDNEKATCTECKKEYIKKDNIWDFRVE